MLFMRADRLKQKLDQNGEIMVVLESGVEYDLHSHTSSVDVEEGFAKTEGMKDGEYVVVEFPTEAVEHTYTHREA
jgi:hypothetical protein